MSGSCSCSNTRAYGILPTSSAARASVLVSDVGRLVNKPWSFRSLLRNDAVSTYNDVFPPPAGAGAVSAPLRAGLPFASHGEGQAQRDQGRPDRRVVGEHPAGSFLWTSCRKACSSRVSRKKLFRNTWNIVGRGTLAQNHDPSATPDVRGPLPGRLAPRLSQHRPSLDAPAHARGHPTPCSVGLRRRKGRAEQLPTSGVAHRRHAVRRAAVPTAPQQPRRRDVRPDSRERQTA